MAKGLLLGSWRLISWTIEELGGAINYPLGEDAVGQLTYTSDGRMSAQLARRQLPRFASNDWRQAAGGEKGQAWSSYFGYFGTYSIDEEAKTVEHHIEGSWFPNLVGTTEKRRYRFDGGQLLLDAETAWGKVHIIWEKIPSG
jgi:Lipocalin-like domain